MLYIMLLGFNHTKLYVSIFSLFALLCMGLSSCGNDDDEKSDQGESTIVDDVNVGNGKKLVELISVTEYESYSYLYYDTLLYKVQYDSKGRINKVLSNNLGNNFGKDYNYNKGDDIIEMEIDYDLRILTIYDRAWNYKKHQYDYHPYSLSFAFNDDGYISQIGNIILKYDSNGYLESVDSPKGLATLSINNNDLFKASLSNMLQGQIQLLYATFADTNDKGELYVRVSSNPQSQQNYLGSYAHRNFLCLIAYQSGLFGKVTKSFLQFKDPKEANMFFDFSTSYDSSKLSRTNYYKCYFKFQ